MLIEQKSQGHSLDEKYPQSDGSQLTPFEQAYRYSRHLPHPEIANWIITSNFSELWIYDMRESTNPEPFKVQISSLPEQFNVLGFIITPQTEQLNREIRISKEAGLVIGEIYDALKNQYLDPETEQTKDSLCELCVRLVFCLYAEDAGIFRKQMFHDFLAKYDAEDIQEQLRSLFLVLNQDDTNGERDKYLKQTLRDFPYVNGGLFENRDTEIPPFTDRIRRLLLEEASERINWSHITPTVFGAIFESTLANRVIRRTGGMVYTSVENIHKVIDPLFLDALEDEFHHIIYENVKTQAEYRMEEAERERQVNEQIKTLQAMPEGTKRQKQLDLLLERQKHIRYEKSGLSKRRNASINQILQELEAFHNKLAAITVLDPACGSGNFLTEAYLSLRRLENKVIKEKRDIRTGHSKERRNQRAGYKNQLDLGKWGDEDIEDPIRVTIDHFYGIEVYDFAVKVARTALWIAENQMMKETEDILHQPIRFLPLRTAAHIWHANALSLDWNEVIHASECSYVCGNPPFSNSGDSLTEEQKKERIALFPKHGGDLDYVACWYKKAADYIADYPVRCAFVSTNSICQGQQVPVLWKTMADLGISIDFAYQTFIWTSEASESAHVYCVIVGFSRQKSSFRLLYDSAGSFRVVEHINGYLLPMEDMFISKRRTPVSNIPQAIYGIKPADHGYLILREDEKDALLNKEPMAEKWIRPFITAKEYLNGVNRYCLWLEGISPQELDALPLVKQRVRACAEWRKGQKPTGDAYKLRHKPMLMRPNRDFHFCDYIVLPLHTGERRDYIPFGFSTAGTIPGNSVSVLPDATLYHFGVLSSRIHMVWTKTVCGRLEGRYRYASDIVYNNFVWPDVTAEQLQRISESAHAILDTRKANPGSLKQLYDPTFMPDDLRRAHEKNDRKVAKAYGFSPDMSDEDILCALMEKYRAFTR